MPLQWVSVTAVGEHALVEGQVYERVWPMSMTQLIRCTTVFFSMPFLIILCFPNCLHIF